MSPTLSQCPACLVSGSEQDAQMRTGVRTDVWALEAWFIPAPAAS